MTALVTLLAMSAIAVLQMVPWNKLITRRSAWHQYSGGRHRRR
ncbi:hypothetical protein [Haloechinothrix alba]|nr:hypothetical protein [Haloechinothrix alba]